MNLDWYIFIWNEYGAWDATKVHRYLWDTNIGHDPLSNVTTWNLCD